MGKLAEHPLCDEHLLKDTFSETPSDHSWRIRRDIPHHAHICHRVTTHSRQKGSPC
jgi:hypothetical protein